MRIAVDYSAAFNQGAGIGRYARNLVPAATGRMQDTAFSLFYAPEPDVGARYANEATERFGTPGQVAIKRAPFDRRRADQIWFRARMPLPIEIWVGSNNLVYSPDFTAPPSLRSPSIVTVHDLAFEIVPERAPDSLRRYLSAVVPRQIKKSAAIVAVSESTKHDLVRFFGVSPNRVTVIPNAADDRFFSAVPLTPVQRQSLGLPDRFLFCVGTIEPRKNHLTLFDALESIAVHQLLPLVIAGRIGWNSDGIMERAQALQRAGRVILLDYVDDRLLPRLYASAAAVVYPSWYEGFGLPVLEGLAAGRPVIASDVPAHREVAGDEAQLVTPGNAESIAKAIIDVHDTDEPTAAEIERRRWQARRYSWESSGAMLAQLFREVATP